MDQTALVVALTRLTYILSLLSFALISLVLVDCLFLYRRIVVFLRKRKKEVCDD
jgi:hypothetical protein